VGGKTVMGIFRAWFIPILFNAGHLHWWWWGDDFLVWFL